MDYTKINKNKLISYFQSGIKNPAERKIGMEIEHLITNEITKKTLSYYGAWGIENILGELANKYKKTTYSQGHLIGLWREKMAVTLEPGGQFETSVGTCHSIGELKNEYKNAMAELTPILEKYGAKITTLGYHPKTKIEDVKIIPKKRYEFMAKYFKTTGSHGGNMMCGTASTQISLDYTSEGDFAKIFHIANGLSPLFSLLTDNTPIFEGEIFNGNIPRTMVWNNVDANRCMVVKNGLNKTFAFGEYADYILNNPCILTLNNLGEAEFTADDTVAEIYKNQELNTKDIEHIISMFFPDVRLKTYVEIRMADSLPIDYALSYAALLKGLFYSDDNKDYLYSLTSAITNEDVAKTKINMMEQGFNTSFLNKPVAEFIDDLFIIAEKSLPSDEGIYLMPLWELAKKQKTLAEIYKENLR
ncbi:MAG: glutamate-cysteine ligase family protein [Clostridiales bacterium]